MCVWRSAITKPFTPAAASTITRPVRGDAYCRRNALTPLEKPSMIFGMDWSHDLVIQLIKEYRNKRELWDPSCETYRLSTVKFEAWQDLASMFDCEIIDVKRKMNSLLASCRRERAKVSQGAVSTWFAMPYMRFLTGRGGRDAGEPESEEIEIPEETVGQNSDSEMSEHNMATIKMEHLERKKKKPHRERLLVRNKAKTIAMLHTPSSSVSTPSSSKPEEVRLLEAIRALHKPEKKRDECDIFGEYIANSLRKHDQRTRAMIKHAMNNILFESEMKKYNMSTNYQHVEINLTEETNPLIIPDQTGDTIPIEDSMMEAHGNLSHHNSMT